eukprot:jgi/Chlat1/2000/Chrsp158S02317
MAASMATAVSVPTVASLSPASQCSFLGSRLRKSASPSSRPGKCLPVRAALGAGGDGERFSRRGLLGKLLGGAGLAAAAAAVSTKPALAADEAATVASSRMSYSRFLEYLDMDRVKKFQKCSPLPTAQVDLYENGTIAIVEAISPELGNRVQRVRVQLPGTSQELLQRFREKKIDFAAHNATEDSGAVLFNILGNLAFPLLLVGGLFLLSRRSGGGGFGPGGGGPGNPLAFGKSKAKFQMPSCSCHLLLLLTSHHCSTLEPGHDAVQKVTLVPRGQARGLTWFIPGEDPTLISRQQIFARIVGALGGRAAEEIIFGEPEVTTGAGSDLMQVARMAKQMVTVFGMSDIGPWALTDPSAQGGDMIMRMLARNSMSEKLAEDIDAAVSALSQEAYNRALDHIRNNREAMDKIVEVLVEKETITGDEFRSILSQYTTIPEVNKPLEPVTV